MWGAPSRSPSQSLLASYLACGKPSQQPGAAVSPFKGWPGCKVLPHYTCPPVCLPSRYSLPTCWGFSQYFVHSSIIAFPLRFIELPCSRSCCVCQGSLHAVAEAGDRMPRGFTWFCRTKVAGSSVAVLLLCEKPEDPTVVA